MRGWRSIRTFSESICKTARLCWFATSEAAHRTSVSYVPTSEAEASNLNAPLLASTSCSEARTSILHSPATLKRSSAQNLVCVSVVHCESPVRRPKSEEHTSELQSRRDLVCRLLLEKKKKNKQHIPLIIQQKKTKTKQ